MGKAEGTSREAQEVKSNDGLFISLSLAPYASIHD